MTMHGQNHLKFDVECKRAFVLKLLCNFLMFLSQLHSFEWLVQNLYKSTLVRGLEWFAMSSG